MNLNQITLPVNDIVSANEFYLKLGFTQIVDSAQYSRFECPVGNSSFSLSLEKGEFNNGAVIYFEHEELDELVQKLISQGIKIAQMPTEQSYLWREAILFDPSGNKVKLFWAGKNRLNPPWRTNKQYQSQHKR